MSFPLSICSDLQGIPFSRTTSVPAIIDDRVSVPQPHLPPVRRLMSLAWKVADMDRMALSAPSSGQMDANRIEIALPVNLCPIHRSDCGILSTGGKILHRSLSFSLDSVDLRILRILSADGRASDVSIGERIHLSSSAVARRRKILEDAGIIQSYHAQVNMAALGFSGVVMVMIELRSQAENVLNEFEQEVVKCPSMSYCGFVSGDTDFIIMIHVNSFNEYDKIYRQELSILPHIAKIRSSFVMREVARRSNPPGMFD